MPAAAPARRGDPGAASTRVHVAANGWRAQPRPEPPGEALVARRREVHVVARLGVEPALAPVAADRLGEELPGVEALDPEIAAQGEDPFAGGPGVAGAGILRLERAPQRQH